METFVIRNLTFSYPEQSVPALCGVDLNIARGAFFVLCGHSGCGKSTLLRQLKPSLAPHGERSGDIRFDGQPLDALSPADAAARIGYVMQSPEAQVVTDKVWHELAFGLEGLGYDTPTIRRRCAEMAAFFGIEPWYYKNVSELSGGQKQLLCLASVMTMQPEVLILDEPTAQLDPIAASEFLATLGKINREFGTTVILSEHRLEEALALATSAAVMEGGRMLCQGSVHAVGQYLKAQKHDMFSAMPCAMRVWGSTDSSLPCPITVNDGRAFLETYTAEHPAKPLPQKVAFVPTGDVRLQASEVWFRYEKELPDVVKGLELSVHAGEMFCILGGNGSGKTTTLKLLGGIRKPYRGDIQRNGTVGLLPQDPQTVFVRKTVYEDLKDALKLMGVPKERQDGEIGRVASLCRIAELLDRHPYDLSGGEQQRAALARILLLSPDILMLDEPTKGLDLPFKETLADILRTLTARGVCVLMVSHDIEFCARYADRCGLFFDGHLVTVSEPTAFFAGNSFYTTAANRMARDIEPRAVTAEDVIRVIGGSLPAESHAAAPTVEERAQAQAQAQAVAGQPKAPLGNAVTDKRDKPLPLWRRICAAIAGLGALGLFIWTAKSGELRELIDENGITRLGARQLALYGAFILLLVLVAVFLGRRSTPALHIQTPKEKRNLSRRTWVAAVMILLLVPLTLFIGVVYLERKQYSVTALAVLIECMLPFFLVFEGRKPKARELVTIATLCAMAIAGRAAFFMLPQFKPVLAMTVIAGVAFGGETGFLVGAVSMLVSNMLFSQGPWTPWQMFAMGIIGFIAGILYRKGLLRRTRLSLAIFGAVSTIVIYGGIMNPAAAIIWSHETLNLRILLSYIITGFPMDAVHAAATALFLWFGAEPLLEKLDRIKVKYGLVEPGE